MGCTSGQLTIERCRQGRSWNIFLLVGLLASQALTGCMIPHQKWEGKLGKQAYEKQSLEINLSTGERNGYLVIHSFPPSVQMIRNYRIFVDNNDPIDFFKYNVLTIRLDEGNHFFKIGAKNFGRMRSMRFEILAGQTKTFEYKGPYWIWDSGKLKSIP